MKTPKDILFGRHRPVEPKLDAIRQEVVATIRDREATDRCQNEIGSWWQFFWASPQARVAMAAIWILIFAFKLSTHDDSHGTAKRSSIPPEAMAELRQQQLLFSELIGWREPRDAKPPKNPSPRPRSERRRDIMFI